MGLPEVGEVRGLADRPDRRDRDERHSSEKKTEDDADNKAMDRPGLVNVKLHGFAYCERHARIWRP